MKKLFSYLLISSMVILSSCTNYDDQFDDLNTQINSLKSQIEGFSSLSSGLTSLQGTVANLQAAVAALPKSATPATDISGLEASVAALQAALSGAATSAEVAALTADLAATQAALDASIAAASTPATDISGLEATVAELKTALAAASTSAEITALTAELAATEVALAAAVAANATAVAGNTTDIAALAKSLEALSTTIAALQTTLGTVSTAAEVSALAASLAAAQADLDVLLSQSSFYATAVSITTVAELEFATSLGDKLNVVNSSVTITQTADMDATALQAVMAKMLTVTGAVVYNSTSTPTTKSSFTNLKSAGSLNINQTGGGNISLPNFTTSTGALIVTGGATTLTVSLPKLVSAGTFALTAAKATTFSAPVLAAHDHSLTINIADSGSIDLSKFTYSVTEAGVAATSTAHVLTVNAATLTAPVFKIGKIVSTEVASVSLPEWEGTSTSTFTDATTVVLPKIKALGGDLSMTLQTMFPDAASVHIVGNSSTSTGASPVTTEVSVTSLASPKLETLILGGTFSSVSLTNDSDLVTLTVDITAEDFTLDNSDVVTAAIDMTAAAASSTGKTSVTIQNNTKLTSMTINEVDDLNSLVIFNNSDLVSVSFPELNSATGTAAIATVKDNDLKGTITYSKADKSAGALSGTSGLVELGDFFDSVITKRTASVLMEVILDEVTEVSSTGISTDATDFALVKLQTAVSTTVGAIDVAKEKRAYTLDTNGSSDVNIKIGTDWVFVNASGGRADITPSGTMALAAAELASSAAVTRAAALGIKLSTAVGANVQSLTVSFNGNNDSAVVESTAGTVSSTNITTTQYAKLNIGSYNVTATSTDPVGGIATALVNAYNAKYPVASRLYTLTDNASTIVISVSATTADRAHLDLVSITTHTASQVAGAADALLAYKIGTLTDDNRFKGNDVIVMLEEVTANTFPASVTLSSTSGITSSTLAAASYDPADKTTFDDYAENAWGNEAREGRVSPYYAGTGGTTTVTGANHTTDLTAFL